MARKASSSQFQFETALSTLETIVEEMEQGSLTLEQSLEKFEAGFALVKQCQQALQNAEQKVQTLSQKFSEQVLTSFEEVDEEVEIENDEENV